MKIVINCSWGGFNLSPKAIARYAELQGRPCYFFMRIDGKWIRASEASEVDYESFIWMAFDVPEMPADPASNRIDHGIKRDDPLLVRVVEELGEDAAPIGKYTKLAVVEIPDGVRWYIHDHDGMETVHEGHRAWDETGLCEEFSGEEISLDR